MKRIALIVMSLFVGTVLADDVELMTRYVVTSYTVNQLSGVQTETGAKAKLVRTTIKVLKYTEDKETFLGLYAKAGENSDKSDATAAILPFAKQADFLAALKDASAKMVKANNAIKPNEATEKLWEEGSTRLDLVTSKKVPRALVELTVGDRTYVLRTVQEFDKLIAAIRAVK